MKHTRAYVISLKKALTFFVISVLIFLFIFFSYCIKGAKIIENKFLEFGLKKQNIQNEFPVLFNDYKAKRELSFLKFLSIAFNEDLELLKQNLISTNFAAKYPRESNILKLRQQTKMTRREFKPISINAEDLVNL